MKRWRTGLYLLAGLLAATPALAVPCVEPDNGTGTADLPPWSCEYASTTGPLVLADGFPPGTTLELTPLYGAFACNGPYGICSLMIPPPPCEIPLGIPDATGSCYEAILFFDVVGTGSLAGYTRFLAVPVESEVHWGPHTPGDPVQNFVHELIRLEGYLFGDPDFCGFHVLAGTDFGLPTYGQTTLTELPSGDFNVESFFDITIQIDWTGCPGSMLDGLSGTNPDTGTWVTGEPYTPPTPTPTPTPHIDCMVSDNGSGTADLPPLTCAYVTVDGPMLIIDGLPAGDTIELDPTYQNFLCSGPYGFCSDTLPSGDCEMAGGALGGTLSCFPGDLDLVLTGTGSMAGFTRSLTVSMNAEAHWGARNPGDPVQLFSGDMYHWNGEIYGDPDFDILRITGGTSQGLPSPGQTVLTELPSGDYAVDSFFDITYRIEFQGAPGSQLDGLAGTTQGTRRYQMGAPPSATPTPGPAIPTTGGCGTLLLCTLLGGLILRRRR